MSLRHILRAVVLLTAVLGPEPAAAQDVEFGASLAGAGREFWNAMERGITRAAADLGVRVVIRSPIDDDPQTVADNLQMKMVQSLIDAGAKAIVLAPIPVHAMPTPIELPVPVVFVDRSSRDYKAVSTVSTDNYAAGRVAAMSLKDRLPVGAKLAVFRLAPDVVSTTARETGFIAAAKELGFEVAIDTYIGHGLHEPQEAAAAALAAYGGRIDAAFTPTDFTTMGTVRAIEALPQDRRPLLVGFDYRPVYEDYLRQGKLHAFVVQDSFGMGYRAVQLLVQIRSGRPVPESVTIDTIVVTAANVGDARIQAALKQYRD
jgi:ribose transport system substrate-binding protein